VQWKQVVTGLALLAILCAACSATTLASPAATRATAKPAVSVTNEPTPGAAAGRSACTPTGSVLAISPMRRSAASWPERSLLRQSPAEPVSDQVISPTTDTAYALTSRTRAPAQRPYILECTGPRTGGVHTGPRFSVGSLALVSGYLWIYGTPEPGSLPVISQVSQATLTRIRSVPLPPRPAGPGGPAFAAGPDDSVWIGYAQTLLRVDAATGAVVTRVTLPPGLGVSNISADPARTTLYVSAARAVRGGFEGLVMLEYDARSGRQLAAASSGVLRYSVAGASLTAVPGGVWVSFRTGMLGLTVHLRRTGLRMIAPPGPGIAQSPASGPFHWPMFEVTAYGGGALWLANQLGIVACLDPRSGTVRASERIGRARQLIYSLQAIDPVRRAIYASTQWALVQISPPRRCWR